MARDTNFYYSFLVLPAEQRRAIVAVWDFCRTVDDAVDCPPADRAGESPAEALRRWRNELAACFGEQHPLTPQGRTLKPYIARFALPRRLFEDLIDGVEMDTVTRRYRTFDELYQYCIRVASAVGLLCIEIFGYRDPVTREYAVALGVALQLTNIVRDLPEDLRDGRLYLPLEDLERFGCTEDDLRGGRSDRVLALLRYECGRGETLLRHGQGDVAGDRQATSRGGRDYRSDLLRYPQTDRAARLRRVLKGCAGSASSPCLDRRHRLAENAGRTVRRIPSFEDGARVLRPGRVEAGAWARDRRPA